MLRKAVSIFVFVFLLALAGCALQKSPPAANDTWFRQQQEAFDRQRAEHMRQSSEAVQGYQHYRNR